MAATNTRNLRKRFAIVAGIAGTLGALALLVLFLLARSPERRVAHLLAEAQIYKRTGELVKEGETLERALSVMPADAGLMAKLGRNLVARGELSRAETLFRASLERNPNDVACGFDCFEVLVSRGALDEAALLLERLYKQAQVVAPEAYRDRVLAGRADLALRRGDRKKARESLEAALQVNPALDAPIRLALAGLLATDGEGERAEELVRSLWNARQPKGLPAPRDDQERITRETTYCTETAAARAALALGAILVQRGAVDEAASVLIEGWERMPDDTEVAWELAEAEIARGRFEAALEVATKLEAKKKPSEAAMVRGRVALAKNDREGAEKAFGDAASWAPGVAAPALAAARCLLDQAEGDRRAESRRSRDGASEASDRSTERAEAERLLSSVDTRKASLDERVERARLLRELGSEALARAEVDAVLAIAPGNPGAIDLLVRMDMAGGKPEEAAKALDELAKRSPGNRVIERARTVLALWSADPGKAVELSRDDLNDATGAGSMQILTAALALDGGVASAVKELEKLSGKAPDDTVRIHARLQAAELYRALGREDLAIPILEKGVSEHPLTKELRLALASAFLASSRPSETAKVLAPLLDGAGDPAALLLAASAAQAQSHFDAAVALARRAESDPVRGVEAVAIEALSFRASGNIEAARGAFARLRDLRPSAPLGYVGALCDLATSPTEAATVLRKACDLLGPERFDLAFAVALDLGACEDEAVRAARSAFERNKKDAGRAYVYAVTLLRRGRSEDARAALADAGIPSDLRNACSALDHPALGELEELLVLRRHGFAPEAAKIAISLLERAPANLVVVLHAARALAAAGERDQARNVLVAAVACTPRFTALRLELGLVLQALPGGAKAALATFDEGLALVPGDPALELARGMALTELGRSSEAEPAYRSVLRVEPRNAVARNNLAWLLLQRGDAMDLAEALALAKAVVQETPTSPAALDTLARVELARDDGLAALPNARKAVEIAPLDAGIRLTFAKTLDALGRLKDAANQYEVALLLKSSFAGREDAGKRLAELRGGGR
jgi:Flp pilus assembly protein TadD